MPVAHGGPSLQLCSAQVDANGIANFGLTWSLIKNGHLFGQPRPSKVAKPPPAQSPVSMITLLPLQRNHRYAASEHKPVQHFPACLGQEPLHVDADLVFAQEQQTALQALVEWACRGRVLPVPEQSLFGPQGWLPDDLLEQALLPLLDPGDLVALCLTCRSARLLIGTSRRWCTFMRMPPTTLGLRDRLARVAAVARGDPDTQNRWVCPSCLVVLPRTSTWSHVCVTCQHRLDPPVKTGRLAVDSAVSLLDTKVVTLVSQPPDNSVPPPPPRLRRSRRTQPHHLLTKPACTQCFSPLGKRACAHRFGRAFRWRSWTQRATLSILMPARLLRIVQPTEAEITRWSTMLVRHLDNTVKLHGLRPLATTGALKGMGFGSLWIHRRKSRFGEIHSASHVHPGDFVLLVANEGRQPPLLRSPGPQSAATPRNWLPRQQRPLGSQLTRAYAKIWTGIVKLGIEALLNPLPSAGEATGPQPNPLQAGIRLPELMQLALCPGRRSVLSALRHNLCNLLAAYYQLLLDEHALGTLALSVAKGDFLDTGAELASTAPVSGSAEAYTLSTRLADLIVEIWRVLQIEFWMAHPNFDALMVLLGIPVQYCARGTPEDPLTLRAKLALLHAAKALRDSSSNYNFFLTTLQTQFLRPALQLWRSDCATVAAARFRDAARRRVIAPRVVADPASAFLCLWQLTLRQHPIWLSV